LPHPTVLTSELEVEWKEFGIHMGLQLSELEDIKQQRLSQTIDCCLFVCDHWLSHNMEATWDDLLTQFQMISSQQNTIASGLYQYLNSMLSQ